jgi:hypothetical protein
MKDNESKNSPFPEKKNPEAPAPPKGEAVKETEKVEEIQNPKGEEDAPVITDEEIKDPSQDKTQSEETVTEKVVTEEVEFVKKLHPSEKIHFEEIVKAQKKTIAALREENMSLRAENESLIGEQAKATFLANDKEE